MPEENTNPIVGTQTSQNDQATTSQSGNDFVLDFGDDENNMQENVSNIESENLEIQQEKNEETLGSEGLDFDAGTLFSGEENSEGIEQKDKIDGEIENEIEEIENESDEDDFDISLEDDLDTSMEDDLDKRNTKIGSKEEQSQQEFLLNSDDILQDNNEKKIEDKDYVEDSEDNVSKEDMGISTDVIPDVISLENENNNQVDEFEINDNKLFNENSEVNGEDIQKKDNYDNENINSQIEGGMEQNQIGEISINSNESSGDVEDEKYDNSQQTIFGNDDLNNLSNEKVQESLNQPEIGDLIGKTDVNFSQEQTDMVDVNAKDTEVSGESNQELVRENGSENSMSEHVGDNGGYNTTLSNENGISNNTGNQDFTLNYQGVNENVASNNLTDGISNENLNGIQENGTQVNVGENLVNLNANQEIINQTDSQQLTSTISLDQILDTELNNNPQLGNNSTAVSVNLTNNNGGLFGDKKLVGILAGIGLFFLAGIVGILAFPVGNSNRDPGSVVVVEENLEELGGEHKVAEPSIDLEEQQEQEGGDDTGEIVPHATQTIIQQDFPEADREEGYDEDLDEQSGDSDEWSPEPYMCEGDDCIGNIDSQGGEINQLELGDIMDIISDFKSQAEIYYSQGDELQDKQLIKYALQMINLCDNYQKEVENGEGIDEEHFSAFKIKGDGLLDKMEKYLIGDDHTDFSKSNDEENNWEGKEELRNYIYERENY